MLSSLGIKTIKKLKLTVAIMLMQNDSKHLNDIMKHRDLRDVM
jgi:hypothetical protein